jgi:type IV fimbrial biogenesis protein FimT
VQKRSGFSLLELLVVIAVIGILVAIGFVNLPRDRFAVNQAAEGFARDVQLTRFEAIRRNEFMGLRVEPSQNRYFVYIDLNRNNQYDEGEPITKTVDLGASGVVVMNESAYSITFDTRGVYRTIGRNIGVSNQGSTYYRRVCVSTQGRPLIVTNVTCPGSG